MTLSGLAALAVATSALGQAPHLRDSSGVLLIENPGFVAAARPPAIIPTRPTLQIGLQEGDPNLLFNGIVAATRHRDGSFYIADRGTAEIRVFNAKGSFVRKFGRKGDGPGEFRALAYIWLMAGDSVGAWDAASGRFTVFGPDGTVQRTFQAKRRSESTASLIGLVRGPMRDGSFFAYRVARTIPPPRKAVMRDTLVVGRYGGDGMFLGNVGRFLGLEMLKEAGGSMASPAGGTSPGFSLEAVPFAKETILRASTDQLYAGDGGFPYTITAYDSSGKVRRIIRVAGKPRRISSAIIARYRREPGNPGTPNRPGVNPKVSAAFFPETMPAYETIRVDAAERLWVKDYSAPGDTQPRWNIFDRDGRLLGSVPTPPGLEVLEIGSTYLLGVWRDELDVEYLRLYSLSVPSS